MNSNQDHNSETDSFASENNCNEKQDGISRELAELRKAQSAYQESFKILIQAALRYQKKLKTNC